MIVSTRSNSRVVTAWIGIRNRETKELIPFVTYADTEKKILHVRDDHGIGEFAMTADFELFDTRTSEPLTPEQEEQVERDCQAGAEELVDKLLLDIDWTDDQERAEVKRKWLFIVSRWSRLR